MCEIKVELKFERFFFKKFSDVENLGFTKIVNKHGTKLKNY